MPAVSSARWIVSSVAAFGVQRSSSKSSISHWLTDAALASLEPDQPSNMRADRHWAAVIIIVDLLCPQEERNGKGAPCAPYRADWNSYGARPVEFSNLEATVELLKWVMRPNTPSPNIVPTVDGNLQLEWHERGIDLEIRIRSRGRYYVTFEDLQSPSRDWEGPITTNLSQLKAAIDSLGDRPD